MFYPDIKSTVRRQMDADARPMLFKITLPTALNDGRAIPPERVAYSRDRLNHLAGGTTSSGKEGCWTDERGVVICEPNKRVEAIFFPDDGPGRAERQRRALQAAEALAREAADEFHQRAILTQCDPVNAKLVWGSSGESGRGAGWVGRPAPPGDFCGSCRPSVQPQPLRFPFVAYRQPSL